MIAALRAGDPVAFEQLFRQHYAPLCRFAQQLTGAEAEGSDVVEDVFAWVWESRDRLNVHTSLATYLYTSVKHRALNVLRNERRRVDRQARFGITDVTATDPSNDDRDQVHADLLRQIREIISQLPERRRLAITLRWEGGRSNTEIAAILGIAPQSVANLLQRALADIRAALPQDFV